MLSVYEKRPSNFISFLSGFPASWPSLFSYILKITLCLTFLIHTCHHVTARIPLVAPCYPTQDRYFIPELFSPSVSQ